MVPRFLSFAGLLLFLSLVAAAAAAGRPSSAAGAAHRSKASPLAPGLFVLGDSTVDVGTNNVLPTIARADRPPYGRDFDTKVPTGRFCNGRVVVDYLASKMGLPLTRPFLGFKGKPEEMLRGVNYASGSSGMLRNSGSNMGVHVSLMEQIEQLRSTVKQFEASLGKKKAADHISKSVFYVSVGSNDFIHNYFRNDTGMQSKLMPWQFNKILVSTMKIAIKQMYSMHARRIVVMGVAPIGCTPHYLWESQSENGECADEINNMVMQFNYAMRYGMQQLGRELADSSIVFCDAFQGSMDILQHRSLYGFETLTDACCGMGKYNGMVPCLVPEMACPNADTHIWWDEFHPTQAANKIMAENVWSSDHTSMCYPMNLRSMLASKA